jgi:hypothetical protein
MEKNLPSMGNATGADTQVRPYDVQAYLPETRAEQRFHRVERALLRTLTSGTNRLSPVSPFLSHALSAGKRSLPGFSRD